MAGFTGIRGLTEWRWRKIRGNDVQSSCRLIWLSFLVWTHTFHFHICNLPALMHHTVHFSLFQDLPSHNREEIWEVAIFIFENGINIFQRAPYLENRPFPPMTFRWSSSVRRWFCWSSMTMFGSSVLRWPTLEEIEREKWGSHFWGRFPMRKYSSSYRMQEFGGTSSQV